MSDIVISLADQVFSKTASTGIYNFSSGLVHEWAERIPNQLTIFANSTQEFGEEVKRSSITNVDWPIQSAVGRVLWDQWEVYRYAKKTGREWLFLPKGLGSFSRSCPLKLAVYIHDIIPMMYAERYPDSISKKKFHYLKKSYRASLKYADVVFTNTEFTRREIMRWAKAQAIDAAPVHVAGYGFPSITNSSETKSDQLVVLIRPDRHKCPEICLEYMKRWCSDSGYGGEVLFVGCTAQDVAAPTMPRWQWLGRIQAAQCLELMKQSRAVIHFTAYEGFGMPPVEAVLAGTCPVYSAIPVAVEVMKGCGAGFDNTDYESFEQAMDKALTTAGNQITEWANILAASHNWQHVADRILAVL